MLQESNVPFSTAKEMEFVADELGQGPDGAYPHLAEMMRTYALQPESAPDAYQPELDLLLGGLERLRRV